MEPLPGYLAAERDYLEPPDYPDIEVDWDNIPEDARAEFNAQWLSDNASEVEQALREACRHLERATVLASQWRQAQEAEAERWCENNQDAAAAILQKLRHKEEEEAYEHARDTDRYPRVRL